MSDDDRLRERFQSLRQEEAGREPSFASTLARARDASPRQGLRVLALRPALAGAALAMLLAIGWQLITPAPPDPLFEPGRWRVPSDALLQGLPGNELLRELPTIGEPDVRPGPTGRSDRPRRHFA